MTPEQRLAEDRTLRNEARAVFNARLERVRAELDERPIGERVAGEAVGRAKEAAGETLEVAKDNGWVIGATLLVLAGWILRGPLWRWACSWFDCDDESLLEPASLRRRWQAWMPWN